MAQMHILLCKLVFVEMETLDEQALDHTALNYRMDSLLWDVTHTVLVVNRTGYWMIRVTVYDS